MSPAPAPADPSLAGSLADPQPDSSFSVSDALLSDADVAGSRVEIYERVAHGRLVLGRLTDEELVALDDPNEEPFVPSPWYAGLSADQREIAIGAALRSLTARGLLRATPLDQVARQLSLEIPGDLGAVLTMRRASTSMLVGERTAAGITEWSVLYAQPDQLWLEEYVDHIGYHQFAIGPSSALPAQLVSWAAVGQVEDAGHTQIRLTAQQARDEPDRLGELREVVAATSFTRLDVADDGTTAETSVGVYAADGAAYLSRPEQVEGQDGLRYASASTEGLRAALAALLSGESSRQGQ